MLDLEQLLCIAELWLYMLLVFMVVLKASMNIKVLLG